MKLYQKIALFCFSATVLTVTFYVNFTSRLHEFESEAKSREAGINAYIEQSSTFIELMTVYGDRYLVSGTNEDSELFSLIRYDSGHNTYDINAVSGTKYEAYAGNLTGMGSLPESGTYRDEINLALEYNRYFSSFYRQMPEVAWLYYTSENGFINMYPWVSAEDFTYSDMLRSMPFYDDATPQKDPLRQSVWTPVYLDAAGKGLMVTLSSPIYQGDTFRGVVSLDLTTERLGVLAGSEYPCYLVDDHDFVVAAGSHAGFDNKQITFSEWLDLTASQAKLMNDMPAGKVQVAGCNYVYRVNFENAPWKAYFMVPVWEMIGLSTLFTLPVLACCVLLILAFAESEKRRKTQVALSNSLDEVRSYHNLLENAAKHDFLTDTCNRRGLEELFYERVKLDGGKNIPVAFIMGDIDKFKHFNDKFGHTAGDRVLVEIANIMKESISERDVACRWGGEEFVLMLLDKPFEEAVKIAETLRKRIESDVIPWADSITLHATMTFGVAEYNDKEGFQASISNADSAMYSGKQKGRNQVVRYQG